MAFFFWGMAAAIVYVYAGYPGLLRVWARLRTRPIRRAGADAHSPGISIIIAARNEAARLPARVRNLLALDYPAARRQIIVASDGSTDDTLDQLAAFGEIVEVVSLPPGGKAAALNAAVARARHDIVVFADARQMFAPDALRELTAPFVDPTVGAVTGELLLDCESALFANRRADMDRRGREARLRSADPDRRVHPDRRTAASTIGDGVGVYWRYEKELRRLESSVWSTLGATGAIYAMRRALWRPLPADTILDDVLAPMRVVLAGYRVVFNDAARAFDRAAVDADAESRRKVRTLAGNYQILRLEPRLLLPWRNPVWWQYLSHKVGRLLVPFAWLAAFAANIVLADDSAWYQLLLAAQVAFLLLAGYGAILELVSRRRASSTAAAAPTSAGPVIASAATATREVA
ncbi:MAG TPA: glycosyltransferase [Vicinamibacterales bacterium]|jgi:cellulose synthase/poly-beta-1,6-N-acetylglucosamine synthase-like glycosyltransferase